MTLLQLTEIEMMAGVTFVRDTIKANATSVKVVTLNTDVNTVKNLVMVSTFAENSNLTKTKVETAVLTVVAELPMLLSIKTQQKTKQNKLFLVLA